ncbi:MAG: hypothetical protein WB443_08870 [Nitrososphaeraceae archaeon]
MGSFLAMVHVCEKDSPSSEEFAMHSDENPNNLNSAFNTHGKSVFVCRKLFGDNIMSRVYLGNVGVM